MHAVPELNVSDAHTVPILFEFEMLHLTEIFILMAIHPKKIVALNEWISITV